MFTFATGLKLCHSPPACYCLRLPTPVLQPIPAFVPAHQEGIPLGTNVIGRLQTRVQVGQRALKGFRRAEFWGITLAGAEH